LLLTVNLYYGTVLGGVQPGVVMIEPLKYSLANDHTCRKYRAHQTLSCAYVPFSQFIRHSQLNLSLWVRTKSIA